MFKLLTLQLQNHPFLGNLKLKFTDIDEYKNGPYTTVIIGPNGTGKSQILRMIVNIFREYDESLKLNPNSIPSYPDYKQINRYADTKFMISFSVNETEFLFTNYSKSSQDKENDFNTHMKSKYFHPNRVIANSILLNDRFPMINSSEDNIYQYMGVRRSPQVAGTRDYIKKIVNDFSKIANKPNFQNQIVQMLQFLGFKKTFWISHYPKRKNIFFTGKLTKEYFHKYFTNWQAFSSRRTEPWSISYYQKIHKNKILISELVDFINFITMKKKHISSRTWVFLYNILDNNIDLKHRFELLDHLRKLDILSYPGIEVEKGDHFDIEETSSGEYHFLLSFLGILSRIQENSLILLDEPDISLHPNWQMKYINALKSIFSEYNSCHFIIVTHSHFLISDLKPESSSLIALTKDQEGIISQIEVPKNTYGWSAEEILYSVFNVKSTRNSYIEYDLTKLLTLINKNSDDIESIESILQKLYHLKITEGDPLNIIIEKTEKYLKDFNA